MSEQANLTSFQTLLDAAKNQEEPQRLLFVFAQRTLGEHVSPKQRENYELGSGGHLEPCMCVDKAPEEIASFEALRKESENTETHWDIMFVSSLSGRGGIPPNSDEADQPLRFMIMAINEGKVEELAAFDREGHALKFV